MAEIRVSGRISSVRWDEFSGETFARIVPEVNPKGLSGYLFTFHFAHPPVVGEVMELVGELVMDPKHGKLLKVKSAERKPPTTPEGELAFLTGFIQGMTRSKAEALLAQFGGLQNLIQICKTSPQELDNVPCLAKTKKLKARLRMAQWDRNEIDVDLFTALHAAQVRADQIQRLVRHFGPKALKVVAQTEPYSFCEVQKIGFATAERVAWYYCQQQDRKFDPLHPMRLLYGICDVVAAERQRGHACVPEEYLVSRAIRFLRSPDGTRLPDNAVVRNKIQEAISEALARRLIIREYDMIYTRGLWKAESELARQISKIKRAFPPGSREEQKAVDSVIKEATVHGINLSDEQQNAVRLAVSSGISAITGGPGVGKTLTISQVVAAIKKLRRSFMVLAPTGKAAKRASDVMGEEASTVHRACGLDQEDDVHSRRYGRRLSRHDYLRADYIIVDESSMIDLPLAFELLRRVRPGSTRVIFVGDVNQLPPVGPGQPFRDILDSGVIPVQRLTKTFRQAGGSPIIDTAYAINRGEIPVAPENSFEVRILNPHTSRKYVSSPDPEANATLEEQIILEWLMYSIDKYAREADGAPLDAVRSIQVYAPQKTGPCGLNKLNEILRDHFNPLPANSPRGREAIKIFGGFQVQPGDKVMQVQNNYRMRYAEFAPDEATEEFRARALVKAKADRKKKKGKSRKAAGIDKASRDVVPVMNGQIGYVARVDYEARKLYVKFDDLPHEVVYENGDEWRKLAPAYAMSIHRSQGSENPYAFIVLHSSMNMLNRPLLYTGWTRAKKGVLLIAVPEVIKKSCESLQGVERYSCLDRRLREFSDSQERRKIA